MRERILTIADEGMKNLDTLIFLSTEGNGGTHLMLGTLALMSKKNEDVLFVSGDHYVHIARSSPAAFVAKCSPYKFVVFDNIEVGCSNPHIIDCLTDVFPLLQKNDKKVLTTYTVLNMVDFRVPEFILSSRHELFYSLAEPSTFPEIIRRSFDGMGDAATDEVINALATETYINVRELIGRCVRTVAAKEV